MSRIHTVHLPEGRDPVDAVLIDDRWRWGAFLFPLLWALWSRHWLLALALVALSAAAGALAGAGWAGAALALDVATRLAFGFEGGAAARLDRRLRGWREIAAVSASTAEAAEARWLLGRRPSARVGPWGAAA